MQDISNLDRKKKKLNRKKCIKPEIKPFKRCNNIVESKENSDSMPKLIS